ncbi:ABC transporter substrate-binding protein [Streptomyces rapamycinicus]|uniref:Nitrate ABC transporter substrate-binding protein n=2 Tax=Streptomyces rapamycinicus TaxID=1226757 RepID=A0A0A0NPU2_STRRN|nr:ABC transporter substrate-binding protein [Streptomyces rapamycinicus]AGP59226.1 nitrate ABC transporter substrate-binding protein [Streptomyces rapamycinicus NRRL 5491]MBB4786971.1 NitT/TauT family transport system substrate-binding protein [Streptomyces rapamycinicus]RLV77577.1 nitrate ABC transporter substrate-binding protein [Streptomyces rapamycinicus NRRL 5491]UTO66982.1 ABC transporter substrate-binding protein [Streptomyces rapamycinicus]UTP34939.1 ABC transporter substrate-binding 
MRNSIRRTAAITGAVLLTTLSGCAGNSGKNSMTLMLDVAYLPKHAPFISAVKRGFFKAEGIDLTVMPGSGSTNTVTSVVTGKVDAGWADFGATVTAQGRGAKVKQVNLLQARSAYAVVGLAGTGINKWSDLRGKTVATEGGGAMAAMWPFAMHKLGLKQGDVNVVSAASASKIPGLLAGQWDANLALYVSDQPAIDALGRKAVVLKWSDLGIDLYGNGIVVSDEKLKNDPDQVRRFNRAMQKGFLWACQHPTDAAKDFQKEVSGYQTDTITLAIRAQCGLNWSTGKSANQYGAMDDAGARKTIDVARKFLGLNPKSNLTPQDVYSNSYLTPLHPNQTIQAP